MTPVHCVLLAFLFWSTCGPLLITSHLGWAAFIVIANLAGNSILFFSRPRQIIAGIRQIPPALTVAMGAFLALNASTFFMAFERTTITHTLLLHATAPIYVIALAPLILKEARSRFAWQALALALTGVALVLISKWTDSGSADSSAAVVRSRELAGMALALISAVGYCGMMLSTRAVCRLGIDPGAITVAVSFPVTFIVLPFVNWQAITPAGAGIAALGGVLHIVIASVLYARGLTRISAETAGILSYTEVLFGHIWDVLWFKQLPSVWVYAGAALIITGGALAVRGTNNKLQPESGESTDSVQPSAVSHQPKP